MWRTVKGFWPYLWPEDRADLRMRIIMATGDNERTAQAVAA